MNRNRWIAIVLAAVAWTSGAAQAADPVDLRVGKDSNGGVRLDWTGGAPYFEVYRADAAAGLLDAKNLLEETLEFSTVDASQAPGNLLFYTVRTRSDCRRPIGDALVRSSQGGTPLGGTQELGVENSRGNEDRSYLRFSMDGIPQDAIVESATLILEQSSGERDGPIGAYTVPASWTEAGVTWNDQPGPGDLISTSEGVPGVGARQWDLQPIVRFWVDGTQPNHGIVLSTDSFPVAVYGSRETAADTVPRLCIDWRDPVMDRLADLDQASEIPPTVRFDGDTAATTDVQVVAASNDAVDAALGYLDDHRELFRLDSPKADLYLDRLRDRDGLRSVSFGRRVDGVPVLDETLLVQTDGLFVLGSSSAIRAGRSYTGSRVLGPDDARQEAIASLQGAFTEARTWGVPSLYWVPTELGGEEARLAYRVQTSAKDAATGEFRFQAVYVDAENGADLLTIDVSQTGDRPGENFETKNANNEGSDTCFLLPWEWKDTWHDDDGPLPGYPGPPTDFASDSQLTTNYTHGIFHYFQDNFGWDGLNGGGGGFVSYVHWNAPGFNNARFTPFCNMLSYGDGWGTPDIVGHEFTHGVVFHSVPLWSTHEPGAINEHLGDFFGSEMDGNWTLGEARRDGGVDLDGDGMPDTTWISRTMSDPPAQGDPDHMDDFRVLGFDNDSGGVHTNNGIPNKAVYMMTDGDTHRGISTSGIGRAKARQLVFDVMVSHLHPWSDFSHLGDEMVRGAQRFQRTGVAGFTINDVCDVINAYASVGLGSPDTDCDGVPNDPSDDGDGDRIPDVRDNCPLDANITQRDIDGDGIGDVCDPDMDDDGVPNDADNCPTVVNDTQDDADGDGTGDLCDDQDRDGVLDIHDNCPAVYNYIQTDQDGDGVGDACDSDLDGDGVANTTDNCPRIANDQTNSDGDAHGNACDNCRFDVNDDQSDIDGDDLGDVCDDDMDGDGVLNDDDNCPVDANPQQFDFDFDGIGTICDATEREFFSGLRGAQELALFMPHENIAEAMRLALFPCLVDDCPDRLDPGFNTTVTLTGLSMDYAVRIVDDRGFVVTGGLQSVGGDATLRFDVDHEYFYRDTAGASPYQGRSYFLEFFAPPGSSDGQILEGFIRVDSSLD